MEACVESAAQDPRGEAMVEELAGVPRPALQTVFGKVLGRRIWDCARQLGDRDRSPLGLRGDAAPRSAVGHAEIVDGMIGYVCRRAAEALRGSGRQAKAIGLRVLYADGVAVLQRRRLARPTNDGSELLTGAMDLFGRLEAREAAVESVDLGVTSVPMEPVSERAGGLDCAMVGAAAGARAYRSWAGSPG
jgi:nucleotidyltransferase/DNA polymerase involved in DNA repair